MIVGSSIPLVVVHADESCLGNQFEEASRGGAAALIEYRTGRELCRFDHYVSSPDTTNNRMALSGAIDLLKQFSLKGGRLAVVYVSDSQYLVKGMQEWVANWKSRGWRRPRGRLIENLELWKELDQAAQLHDVEWKWVRGHTGHVKNEYANDLAIRAAEQQVSSSGLKDSGFHPWLAGQQTRGKFAGYDPDQDFVYYEERVSTQ